MVAYTGLTLSTSITTDDLIAFTDSPSSSPATKAITLANFGTSLLGGTLLTGSKTYDPPSLTTGTGTSTTVTVTGAAVGDVVIGVSHSSITASGWRIYQPHVTSANTVTVDIFNNTGGTVDLASGTLKVVVLH